MAGPLTPFIRQAFAVPSASLLHSGRISYIHPFAFPRSQVQSCPATCGATTASPPSLGRARAVSKDFDATHSPMNLRRNDCLTSLTRQGSRCKQGL